MPGRRPRQARQESGTEHYTVTLTTIGIVRWLIDRQIANSTFVTDKIALCKPTVRQNIWWQRQKDFPQTAVYFAKVICITVVFHFRCITIYISMQCHMWRISLYTCHLEKSKASNFCALIFPEIHNKNHIFQMTIQKVPFNAIFFNLLSFPRPLIFISSFYMWNTKLVTADMHLSSELMNCLMTHRKTVVKIESQKRKQLICPHVMLFLWWHVRWNAACDKM